MIRTLITILCPVHQEHEKDMSLGPPETGSTAQPGGVCGGKAEHGQAEGSEQGTPGIKQWSQARQALTS